MKKKNLLKQIDCLNQILEDNQNELIEARKLAILQAEEIAELKDQKCIREEYRANADKNRLWCDAACDWLGPFTQQALKKLEALDVLKEDLQHMHDAYYQIGVLYPWSKQ